MEFSSDSRLYLYRIALAVTLLTNRLFLKSSDAFARLADHVPFSKAEILLVLVESGELLTGSGLLVGFLRSSSLVLLYFVVFYGLVDELYPDSLVEYVSENGSLRRFRLWTIVGVLLVAYWFELVFVVLDAEAMAWLPVLLLSFGIPAFLGFGLPLGYGQTLADCQGKTLFSPPDTDGTGVAVLRGFAYGDTSTTFDESSPLGAWWRVSLQYLAVPVFFGTTFFVLGTLSLFPELLLVTAVVAARLRSESVEELVGQVDLEFRFGTAIRYSVVNFKGLVAVALMVAGIIASTTGLVVGWQLLSAVALHRVTVVTGWIRLGATVSLLLFVVVTTWFWLRVAARLPWFIAEWTRGASWVEDPAPEPPNRSPPRLPTTGLVLSSVFLVATWLTLLSWTPSGTTTAETAYGVAWPLLAGSVVYSVRRTLTSSRLPTPEKDNVRLPFAVAVQLSAVVFVLRNRGLFLTLLPDHMVREAIYLNGGFGTTTHFLPDAVFYGGIVGCFLFLYLSPDVLALTSEFLSSSEGTSDRELQALWMWIHSSAIATAAGLYGVGPLDVTGWGDFIVLGSLGFGVVFVALMPRFVDSEAE